MPHRVAFVRQSTYESASLRASIRRAIELADVDISSAAGKDVLLKPNMLGAYLPEMGVTTHPAFVRETGRIFREAGAKVSVGDSGNGVHGIARTWEATGIGAVCREEGFQELHFEGCGSLPCGDFMISAAPLAADIIINLPKFKTHGLTTLTLAAKNLFGCVAGMQKFGLHRTYARPHDFAMAVVKIADAVRPALTIIDGVVGMEGNGPSAGKLRHLKVIAAGCDLFALDAACCQLVGLPPENLETLIAAKELNLWDPAAPIDIAGDPLEELSVADFALPATYTRNLQQGWLSRHAMKLIWSQISARPKIDDGRCVRCGACVAACPVSAISQPHREKKPEIDDGICIQCFCCHEICPYQAIDIHQSWPVRIARWVAEQNMKRLSRHLRRAKERR
jgi:uncharacterized protein (DUF362 family)/Pyruvate/2-oxoacid:ferredoxin oxidoreductase delta subunit